MRTSSSNAISTAARILDAGSLLLAFTLSAWLAAGDMADLPFREVLAIRVKLQNFLLFVGMIAIWTSILTGFGLYQSHIYRGRWRELKDVLLAISCCALTLWILHELFRIQLVGPHFLVSFWLLALAFSLVSRFTLRLTLRRLRRSGFNARHLLIVGTSARALELAQRIRSTPELGYRVIGFVDEQWSGNQDFHRSGYAVVTDFGGFPQYIASNVIDEVMVCIPVKSLYDRSCQILAQCEEQGVTVRLISDVFTPTFGRSHVESFADRLVLTVQTGGMRGSAVAVKRLIDFLVAGALLLILSPLLVVVSASIKLRSDGPVFFVQERLGRNKRRFRLYKFRTMVRNAEQKIVELEHLNEVAGPAFKIRNDPRITPIGRFLRKTSIDELPQLFNVLKGDMSLVGPRPLPVRDYESFSTTWHRRRFSVKPGITCLWQVMGRSAIPFERWMELDMQYIDQWSLRLDLEILLRTIPAVLRGSGAS